MTLSPLERAALRAAAVLAAIPLFLQVLRSTPGGPALAEAARAAASLLIG